MTSNHIRYALACLVMVWLISAGGAVRADVTITVVDRHNGKGVRSQIFLSRNRNDIYVADTDGGGSAVLPSPSYTYELGDRIYAAPISGDYFRKSTERSANGGPLVLVATRVSVFASNMFKLDKLEEREAFGKAAQVSNEAFALSLSDDSINSQELAVRTFKNAARALRLKEDVAVVFDPGQGKEVPSTELVEKIKEFQRKVGLAEDGVLGAKTLNALAVKDHAT